MMYLSLKHCGVIPASQSWQKKNKNQRKKTNNKKTEPQNNPPNNNNPPQTTTPPLPQMVQSFWQSLGAHTLCFKSLAILHWCCIANLAITSSSTKPPPKRVQHIPAGAFTKPVLKMLGSYGLAICDQCIFLPGYDQHCHGLSWFINPLEPIIKQAHMVLVSICLPFVSLGFPPQTLHLT